MSTRFLQGITEASQPQLPRTQPSGQPIESSQLANVSEMWTRPSTDAVLSKRGGHRRGAERRSPRFPARCSGAGTRNAWLRLSREEAEGPDVETPDRVHSPQPRQGGGPAPSARGRGAPQVAVRRQDRLGRRNLER